jgi:signal transduction histidine kinase
MRLFEGITWRRAAITAVVNTCVVAFVKWMLHVDNTFPDLLISGQVVGFTIMIGVSVAGNLPLERLPRPVAQLLAVVLSSFVGTVLVVFVKGRGLAQAFTEWEGVARFSTTATIGIIFGSLVTAFFIFRERDAAARAAMLRVEAEKNLIARRMAEAQLALMQAQVEPHFLFNTLANVRYLAQNDPPNAVRMLDHLIDYLRAALPSMREARSTLGKEIDFVRAYLSIQQIRMGDRLRFAFNVPEALLARPFPPSMAITLVENAIRHGVEPCCEQVDVTVSAAVAQGSLQLSVADTGVGMKRESGSGIGLANLRARLHELFGERGRLVIESNAPHGVTATIEIPDA